MTLEGRKFAIDQLRNQITAEENSLLAQRKANREDMDELCRIKRRLKEESYRTEEMLEDEE